MCDNNINENVKDEGRLSDGRMVLCAANGYDQKYFFNKHFDRIPDSYKEELHIICVLYAAEVGGLIKFVFEEDGDLTIETEAEEDDITYDEISAGLTVIEIRRRKQEMFKELSMYYKLFILKEDPSKYLLNEEDGEE